uniref:SDR family NAD(P)-dependent oxidoreductase n=1 Tax=Roseihalotalea indica TaxID=2867963 RepID=A0AA49GIK2_9BACT|nr:SDR family NAD(P)-dependent oxidoreductase [Tunicatimonas sp. TK19036]
MNSTQKTLLWTAAVGLGGMLTTRFVNYKQREIELAGRVALVTGGSRGLGLALAQQLVEEGARVAICARNKEDLKKAQKSLNSLGKEIGNPHPVLAVSCDVSDQKQVKNLISQIEKHFGSVEILINNAGTIQVAPIEEMEMREYEESINTHYWGPLYMMEEVLPGMRDRQEGRIVNIASIGGKVSVPHLVPYSAGKHALVGLSEGYRSELLKDNIYVTTVCPGLMRTGSPQNAIFKGKNRDEQTWFTIGDSLPMTSMPAEDAAKDIISACRHGESTLVLSLPAKILSGLNGLVPGFVSDALGWVNQWLPEPGGIGKKRMKGYESESEWAPSSLTKRTEKAAKEYNQE